MATTAQQILTRAVERSDRNNASLVGVNEVMANITANERALYIRAARLNPEYFGKDGTTSTRAAYTGTWNLASNPGLIAAVTRIEVAAITGSVTGVAVGDEVNMISLRWPYAGIAPRAYIRGQIVSGYNTELGAADANMVTQLKVYYSPIPTAISSISDSVSLPDEWCELLVLRLARLLSLRDRRMDELQALDDEYSFLFELFQESLIAYDHVTERPLNSVPAIPLPPPQAK